MERQPPQPHILERLGAGDAPTFSFEYFPPADVPGAYALLDAVASLAELRPDWVSVTYGATGSTRQRTFDALRAIRRHSGVQTMGHLTVAGQTLAETDAAIDAYRELGVDHVLALRGDLPQGGPFEAVGDGLSTATQLIGRLKARGDFSVGVAAFPDGHPDHFDLARDARVLRAKQDAGADFAITQLFFRPGAYFELVDRFSALGGTMPIVAGIMPVTSVGQIERFQKLSGVAMPEAFARELRRASDDPRRFRDIGLEWMVRLCDELLAGGAPGLQFFTLNRSKATSDILAKLRQIPPHRS